MTNEELMRLYNAAPDHNEDALMQLYEQNMGLIWDMAGSPLGSTNERAAVGFLRG